MTSISLATNKALPTPGILPKHLSYVLRLYLTGILCFTVFRLILLLQEFHQLYFLPAGQGVWYVVKALLMGLRFDTVVSGYILTAPFLLLCADALLNWNSKWLYRIVFGLISLGYVGAFFVCCADLPYFHHFYSRITTSVMISTSGSSNLLSGMVFKEWRYYWVLGPFFGVSWFFLKRHKRLLHRILFKKDDFTLATAAWSFSLFGLLLFLGIWGRFTPQSHIDAGTAYFSDYGFPNMLGLSPAYTFGLSYVNSLDPKKQQVHFMGDGEAVRRVQEYLNIPSQQEFDSPIARQVHFRDEGLGIGDEATQSPIPNPQSLIPNPQSPIPNPNVVFIIMESMSAHKLGRYGNPNYLTPFMDSLARQSWAFDSVFTSGIHTFAGIYSTLYSMPVIKRQHPFLQVQPHAGIAGTLQQNGYSTVYFTTHDKEFDNIGNFLGANGYDRIVSQTDYPKERVLSPLGCADDYLYEHVVGDLNEMHQSGKPFFAAMMTGSDHGPYIIPKYFKPKNKDAMLAIVEYTDWALGKFFRLAARQPWFDNTLFVVVADHGSALDKRYDLPLSYVHTPLIFYSPKILGAPRQLTQLGSQVDIAPTVLALLKMPYVNNSFGIDLFREKRPYAIAFADDKYGVLDAHHMFVSRENGVSSLYHYPSGNMKDLSETMPEKVETMKNYGESFFQAAQWLRKNGKTGEQ